MEEDCDEFVGMVCSSHELHEPWVQPPSTTEKYATYRESRQGETEDGFLVCEIETGAIVGVINLNCIVRGHFQSAYLGYYGSAGFARKGLMSEGMQLVIRYAFEELRLHRLEANIQPSNLASIALVKRCGFRLEGFSPGYLMVAGEWRDHERWALLADEILF
jgi:ribosomal-protein-alanine N-acetyltransferase